MAKSIRIPLAGLALTTLALAAAAQSPSAQAAQTRNYHIESQPLPAAVNEWADQAGMQVMWPAQMPGAQREAPAVAGRFSAPVALERVLQGSGLTFAFLDEKTVAIRLSSAVGQASPSQAAGKGGDQAMTRSAEGAGQPPPSQGEGRGEDSKKSVRGADSAGVSNTETISEVVVTGTHIRGAQSASPLIVIGRQEIERSGYTVVGDLVRSLPQNYGGGVNPQMMVGNAPGNDGNVNLAGLSAPNLRGLGPGSTLTLLNGRRLAVGVSNGAVDISFVPVNAVERIEVITDGASSVYGSDAVAGVVNVILKKEQQGVQVGATYGASEDGGGTQRQINALLGHSWSSGDFMLAAEHSEQDDVDAGSRDFTQASPRPLSLLPESKSNSLILSANHAFSEVVSVFADGYYRSGESNYINSAEGLPFSIQIDTDLKQYGGTLGTTLNIGRAWSATAFGSTAVLMSRSDPYGVTASSPTTIFLSPLVLTTGRSSTAELGATGPVLDLPTGTVQLAVGSGYRSEVFDSHTEGRAPTVRADDRDIKYFYAEVAVPLVAPSERVGLHRLDLTASGRYERYSDFGGETVPKIGLVYAPTSALNLRGSWSRSFRAPTLSSLSAIPALTLNRVVDPLATAGDSIVIVRSGGNAELEPETSTSWTVGGDLMPASLPGLRLSLTYFNVDYSDRIGSMGNPAAGLADPIYASFVSRNPPASVQQGLLADAGGNFVSNTTNAPYDPATVAAIIDNRSNNIARQKIDGVDFGANYGIELSNGSLDLFLNTAYLDIKQRTVTLDPEQTITGTTFNPPKLRSRAGVTWSHGPMALTAAMNYLDDQVNTYRVERPSVASWTTFDASGVFAPDEGLLSGYRVALSVINILNKDPPYVEFDTYRTGLNYDSLNATPLGRFVSIQLSKAW